MEAQLSPAEQKANAEKLKAEAAQAKAEAKRIAAEAAKLEAETREADAKARTAELGALKAEDEDRARRAGDEFHHVYRFSSEVSASSVSRCMAKLTEWHRLDPNCNMEIIFSSPGGSIIDGMELFDFIRGMADQGHRTITGGTGMAASMAGILLQAGEHRWVSKEAWVLIHRAAFFAFGQTHDVEDQVKLVQRIEKRIIDIFTARSQLTPQKIRRNWNRKDWWLDSDECLEHGLVDEVRA